jgi:hypothetical protein
VPLRTPTILATVAVAFCAAAGAAAEPSQPVPTRYHDIEANKANSMRALGLHLAGQPGRPSRYHDLEANKARSQRAR